MGKNLLLNRKGNKEANDCSEEATFLKIVLCRVFRVAVQIFFLCVCIIGTFMAIRARAIVFM